MIARLHIATAQTPNSMRVSVYALTQCPFRNGIEHWQRIKRTTECGMSDSRGRKFVPTAATRHRFTQQIIVIENKTCTQLYPTRTDTIALNYLKQSGKKWILRLKWNRLIVWRILKMRSSINSYFGSELLSLLLLLLTMRLTNHTRMQTSNTQWMSRCVYACVRPYEYGWWYWQWSIQSPILSHSIAARSLIYSFNKFLFAISHSVAFWFFLFYSIFFVIFDAHFVVLCVAADFSFVLFFGLLLLLRLTVRNFHSEIYFIALYGTVLYWFALNIIECEFFFMVEYDSSLNGILCAHKTRQKPSISLPAL